MWELQSDYKHIAYRSKSGFPAGGTIKNNGSCPTTISNILRNYLGVLEVSPKLVAKTAINAGAVSQSGTNVIKVLNQLRKRFGGFTYRKVSDFAAVKSALAKGNMVMAHSKPDGTFNLLDDKEIYVALIGLGDFQSFVRIHDPNCCDKKWKRNAARKYNVRETDEFGIVDVRDSAIVRACDCYYIFSKPPIQSEFAPEYKIGNKYTVIKQTKIRTRALIGGEFVKKKDGISNKTLTAGTDIYCLNARTNSRGDVFVQMEYGWIMAWDSQTKLVYIR